MKHNFNLDIVIVTKSPEPSSIQFDTEEKIREIMEIAGDFAVFDYMLDYTHKQLVYFLQEGVKKILIFTYCINHVLIYPRNKKKQQ